MAGLNVAEWSPDQVADWLTGLGPTVGQYVEGLRARGLDGPKLLMLRCDDLEYLGMHVIGHQELLLEAVEHLRNFQYELSRECIQQLALKVSVVATSLARQLRHHSDARLETQTLADVARVVQAVKPLVCWLDRWPACNASLGGGGAGGAGLAERKAALLKLSLEAATCAQRDRFAEHPARAVAAAAATTAAVADYMVQEVADPGILAGATLGSVSLRQGGRPLGFEVVPSYCGHHQLADIRFGSPAHASGHVHEGDELVQVNGQCVIGWSGAAVRGACVRGAGGELSLRLRRRGARPPVLAPPPHTPRAPSRALYVPVRIERYVSGSIMSAEVKGEKEKETSAASSSDESEPLSPPASPSLPLDHTRIYPPKPRAVVQRRHTISCGSPINKRPNHTIEQFWQQLKEDRRGNAGGGGGGGSGGGGGGGSAGVSPEPDVGGVTLYARDKAVSYSTGLETSRPRTCLGLSPTPALAPTPPVPAPLPLPPQTPEEERARGKLDKAHSTPAYDFAPTEPVLPPPIPESPPALAPAPAPAPLLSLAVAVATSDMMVYPAEKADQILQFKKSSNQIGEAMTRRGNEGEPDPPVEGSGFRDESTTEKILETINIAMMEHRRRSLLEGRPRPEGQLEGGRGSESRRSRVSPSSPPSPPLPPAPLLGVLRCVPRPAPPARDPTSPLKPHRPLDVNQISGPLRHLTPHEMVAMRAPPLNPSPQPRPPPPDIVVGAHADAALSPTSAVRGIFPTSKSRSLKKKSSILAKRRGVPARALAARGAAGGVWQRVRARHPPAAAPRWTRRHLLLAHNVLYAYRTPECSKADCMIYLEGFTVCAAGEVKSRAHAFKVYHTGTCVYFASDSRDGMLHWIQLIHRATLLPSLLSHMDSSNHFSETDYSDTESDNESPEKRSERDRDRDRDRDRERERDKSKFGSLKKLTGRVPRSESQENVSVAASVSLDRKYLRFFSRNKAKDDAKPKSKSGTPVPTEQYRSYRRVAPPSPSPPPATPPRPSDRPRKLPKPINYIHASNPNLLDFEKSDFVTKPALQPPKQKVTKVAENAVGLVTLEQFMLQKQAEERRQLAVYSDRVLLGVSAHCRRALDTIVADVIYGEVGAPDSSGKPVSVRGRDGYETIVYPDESPASPPARPPYESLSPSPPRAAPPPPPDRWRDSLRRNDKCDPQVHSRTEPSGGRKSAATASQGQGQGQGQGHGQGQSSPTAASDSWNNNGGETSSGLGVSRLRLMFGGRTHSPSQSPPPAPPRGQYPHLQCPPVFHAETYSLTGATRKHT